LRLILLSVMNARHFILLLALAAFVCAEDAVPQGTGVLDEAKLYALSGETAAFQSVAVSSGGYYVLSFNNAIDVVLRASDKSTVNDSQTLYAVAQAYKDANFDSLDASGRQAVLEPAVQSATSIADFCSEGVNFFVSRNGALKIIIIAARTAYPRSYAALGNLQANNPPLGNASVALSSSFETFKLAAASRDSDRLALALMNMSASADDLNKYYANVSAAAEEIHAEVGDNDFKFLWVNGQPHNCLGGDNLTGQLAAVKSSAFLEGFKTNDELVQQIRTETALRAPVAEKRRIAFRKQARLYEYGSVAADLVAKYSAYGVSLPLLNEKTSQLNASFASLNASSGPDAQDKADTFDAIYAEANGLAQNYSGAFNSLDPARKALDNASRNVDEAVRKFGNTDDRIVGFQASLQELRSAESTQEQLLSNGEFGSVYVLDSVALNATAVAIAALDLQPRENQVDWVMIGGVVVLLLALLGGFIYLKKYKEDPSLYVQAKPEDFGSSVSPGSLVKR